MTGEIGGLIRNTQEHDCEIKQAESPSLLENLKRKKLHHENKIKEIDSAISFLKDNPKFEDFSTIINKLRY